MNNKFNKVKYIDLFAGIGGFHQAMNDFDAECVFASEWDKSAAQTYYSNYNITPKGDITKIEEEEIPNHDMLCAGFPCQPFSISGKQRGFEDTRGTLFFDVARIVKHHKPKVVLLENVSNFEKHDNGKTLKTVVLALKEIGYIVFYKVLNASNYGLPQNRERIFIVCFRNDLKIDRFEFPKPYEKKTSLLDMLEKKPSNAKIINRSDIVFTKSFEPQMNLFGQIDLPNKPIQIGYINKGGQGERIYSPFGHAITLSAYGGGVGAKTGLYFIDGVIRKLSPRECARLQGFPDNFKIDSSLTQSYKQLGNSVAVNVLKEIIKEIYNTNCFLEVIKTDRNKKNFNMGIISSPLEVAAN
ncbi:MAG: DNA cytosine methyltransferase [Bacteroidia bacterium]